MTANELYLDTEFFGMKDGVRATVVINEAESGGSDSIPASVFSQMEGTVTLDLPEGGE
jgi:hypothetical protein